MSVDNMRSIVLLLCTCIANFRFYKPSFPYCARLCWIKKWQQQQPESHNNSDIEEFSAASLKSYSTRPKSLPLLGVSVSCQLSPFPSLRVFSIPWAARPSDASPVFSCKIRLLCRGRTSQGPAYTLHT